MCSCGCVRAHAACARLRVSVCVREHARARAPDLLERALGQFGDKGRLGGLELSRLAQLFDGERRRGPRLLVAQVDLRAHELGCEQVQLGGQL